MKTRIAVLVVTALAATATSAQAATYTLTGSAEGRAKSKITMKVKTNAKGVATKVTSLSVTNLTSECNNASTDTSGPGKPVRAASLGSFTLKKSRIEEKVVKKAGFTFEVTVIVPVLKAAKASVTVQYGYPTGDPENACIGGGKFNPRVKKK